jgi:DNA polymerase-3 subunit alpha (Gram-positive type)
MVVIHHEEVVEITADLLRGGHRGVNIEFLPIRLEQAKSRAFTIVDGKLMPSFNSISGMGDKAADQLEEAVKKGPFVSREDVRDRAKISNTIIDKMGELGILGNLPQSNQFSLFDFMNA